MCIFDFVEVAVSLFLIPVALLTQQWHFVLQQLVVAGREDSHRVAGNEASFLHQPLTRLHQCTWELRRVYSVVPPAAYSICDTWKQTGESLMTGINHNSLFPSLIFAVLCIISAVFNPTRELVFQRMKWKQAQKNSDHSCHCSDLFHKWGACEIQEQWHAAAQYRKTMATFTKMQKGRPVQKEDVREIKERSQSAENSRSGVHLWPVTSYSWSCSDNRSPTEVYIRSDDTARLLASPNTWQTSVINLSIETRSVSWVNKSSCSHRNIWSGHRFS